MWWLPERKVCAQFSLSIFPFQSETILSFITIYSPYPAYSFSIVHSSPHYHPSCRQFIFFPSPYFFLLTLISIANSLAITDSTPRTLPAVAQILVCPLFFTATETKSTLDSKNYKVNPGRKDNSWCKPGQKFKDFETGGHTLLHEMTHLNALGTAAGLSERA